MEQRMRRAAVLFGVGLMLVIVGAVWAARATQSADRSFAPNVATPAHTGRWRPEVLIDEGHYNFHTAAGTYEPFARLLRRDGYWVRTSALPFSAAALSEGRGGRVLVVANALGWRGLLAQALSRARLERVVKFSRSALSDDEIAEVERWVRAGGALLLVADHAPAGASAAALAARFGVGMTSWWAEDEQHHDSRTSNPGFLVFSRDNQLLLQDHPITLGRAPGEQIHRVMTFTGQSLRAPAGAASLLTLSPTAREYPFRRSREYEGRSAAGLSQAIALQHGAGRVVVLGEAAMVTAQVTPLPDGSVLRFGMNRDDTDNLQFTLNVMHWLTGLL
jgi:hypothetical protein